MWLSVVRCGSFAFNPLYEEFWQFAGIDAGFVAIFNIANE
jgi:hypothetical protein